MSSIEQEKPSAQRYVRLLRERDDGFVEFVFSIDDPTLGVELILPRDAYLQFCRHNAVRFVSDVQASLLDADAQKWRYGIPGIYQ